MAKANPQLAAIEAAQGPAAVAALDDARKLRAFIKPASVPTVKDDPPLFVAGHNIVVDRRQPDTLRIDIGLDAEAFENILQKDPEAPRYLAKTTGAMYDSREIAIGGKRYFLTVKLLEYVPKAKAKA